MFCYGGHDTLKISLVIAPWLNLKEILSVQGKSSCPNVSSDVAIFHNLLKSKIDVFGFLYITFQIIGNIELERLLIRTTEYGVIQTYVTRNDDECCFYCTASLRTWKNLTVTFSQNRWTKDQKVFFNAIFLELERKFPELVEDYHKIGSEDGLFKVISKNTVIGDL